jgi:hypothetical protein
MFLIVRFLYLRQLVKTTHNVNKNALKLAHFIFLFFYFGVNMHQLSINNTYRFNLVTSGVLANSVVGRVVSTGLSYQLALNYADVTSLHAQILPNLPSGTNPDPRALVYYLVVAQDGNMVVLANAWLVGEPVVITEKVVQIHVKVENLEAQTHIRDLLLNNGYNNIELTVL